MIDFHYIITTILLGTTIWLYTKWRQAMDLDRDNIEAPEDAQHKAATTSTQEHELQSTLPSSLKDYTTTLEANFPQYQFIHYHEYSTVTTNREDIEMLEALLGSIVETLADSGLSNNQILLHSRIKEDHLLLKIKLPSLDNESLQSIISKHRLHSYQVDTNVTSQHSILKLLLQPINTAADYNTTISKTKSATSDEEAAISLDTDDSAILIIEDNEDIANFIATCIPSKYKTFINHDGRSGVTRALQLIPDLIISDIMMPQMDGLELCDLLKNDIRTEHIPIILLTAKVTEEDKIEGFKHGADAYLTKPFDEIELQLRIENLLRLRDKIRKNQSVTNQKPATNELFIAALRGQLESNYNDDGYGVQQLADSLHMSRMQLHRKVKSTLNLTTSEVMNEYRLEKALDLIKTTNKRISEIAYEVGFSDAGYFSKIFKSKYGVSPSQMRN